MLPVQPTRFSRAQEELRPVRVRAGVRHGQNPGPSMLQSEVLVREFRAVNRFSTGAVMRREIAALAHESRDNSMERRILESESWLSSA